MVGEDKNLFEGILLGGFFQVGQINKFSAVEGDSPHPPSRESPAIILLSYFFSRKSNDKIFKKIIKYLILCVKCPINKYKIPSLPN